METTQMLARLRPEAEKIDTVMREDLKMVQDPLLAEVLHHAIFNGGKRLRPLLCMLAAGLCGRRDESTYRLAIAFEYLHVATLLHDDVIDQADRRRGRASVNAIWGLVPAILAGDFLHARSMALVGEGGGPRCLSIFCRATNAMVEGEFLQMRNARNFSLSEADYFLAVDGKTAALISAICEIGAEYAEADQPAREALRSYGAELGQAFQIVDDLLDYRGDPAKTGKAVGNDFIEAKMTLPLIHALASADAESRGQLLDLLAGDREGRDRHLYAAISTLEAQGSFRYAAARARQLIESALTRLEAFNDDPDYPAKAILQGLGRYVLSREK